MQARYYDPVIGRFYSNDPIGFRDVHSFNRYAYANNNPYRYSDPTGMCSEENSGSKIACAAEDYIKEKLEPVIEEVMEKSGVEVKPDGERDPDGEYEHQAGDNTIPEEISAIVTVGVKARMGGNGGLRKKPGSLGESKGRDALRRENKQVKDAANAAGGLTKQQKSKLHDEISGRGYDYHQIVEIAKEIKNGG